MICAIVPERANLKDFDRLLSLVPDTEPYSGDALPKAVCKQVSPVEREGFGQG